MRLSKPATDLRPSWCLAIQRPCTTATASLPSPASINYLNILPYDIARIAGLRASKQFRVTSTPATIRFPLNTPAGA